MNRKIFQIQNALRRVTGESSINREEYPLFPVGACESYFDGQT